MRDACVHVMVSLCVNMHDTWCTSVVCLYSES